MIELWPVAVVAGSGLIAWGNMRARLAGLRRDVDDKASRESVVSIETHLTRIEEKLDRLVERT